MIEDVLGEGAVTTRLPTPAPSGSVLHRVPCGSDEIFVIVPHRDLATPVHEPHLFPAEELDGAHVVPVRSL